MAVVTGKPQLVWAVRCETCGWSYPRDGKSFEPKSGCEEYARAHRYLCSGEPGETQRVLVHEPRRSG